MKRASTEVSICITDLTSAQVQELVADLGEPAYRAEQLQRWVYKDLAISFDEMGNLPNSFRQKLAHKARLHSLTLAHQAIGRDGTVKALFTLADGRTIESTLMPYTATKDKLRCTLCISTQVGCTIRCPFCATGQQGFERNLTSGEIIDQVLYFARWLRDQAQKTKNQPAGTITNLVFMGMGEPLANYDALWSAIEMLNSPQGFALGARGMTISTAGLIPQIRRLSQESLQVGLAISLHAAENELRNRLVPVNRTYPLEELIPAVREYFEKTGRRPTFEYILFEGVNDSIHQAHSLARLLSGLNCHVNLIPANRTISPAFRPPGRSTILAFQSELKRSHINCTLRWGRGLDIDAGCGQLRSRLMKLSHARAVDASAENAIPQGAGNQSATSEIEGGS